MSVSVPLSRIRTSAAALTGGAISAPKAGTAIVQDVPDATADLGSVFSIAAAPVTKVSGREG